MKGCKADGGVCIGGDQCIKFMRCAMGGSLPGARLDPSLAPSKPSVLWAKFAPPPRRNGCHDRPALGRNQMVRDGYGLPATPFTPPARPNWTTVPHAMTTDCQYTSSAAGRVDPGCTGCRWKAP